MSELDDRPFPADSAECELCQAARFTHWYASDDDGWVADCELCQVPMMVWWHHGSEPPPEIAGRLTARLAAVADRRFGVDGWTLDLEMRQVPTHFHAHARDHGWWDRSWTRPVSVYTGVGGSRTTRNR